MFWPVFQDKHEGQEEISTFSSESEPTNHAYFGLSDRIGQGEAMLVDTGAWNNLVGSEWVSRMDKLNSAAGIPQSYRTKLQRPVRLGGNGKKTQLSTESVTVTTTVSGDHSMYKATVIEGSIFSRIVGIEQF